MDDEFKLCWKNFQDNIASGFQNLYDRGDLVDVTLACDGKLLHAHKFVLAICSPYFQEIFITNPCKHPIIILKDVTFNIMCELLEFMYQGVVNVKHTELQAFMKIGQLLQIKGLATNSASSAASTTSEKSSSQNAAKLDTDGKAEAISSTKANTTTTSGSTTTPTTNNSEENAGENSNSGKQTGSNSNPHTPVRSGSPALSSSSRMGVSINPTQPSNTTINKSSSDSSSHQSMHGGYHHSLTSGKRYFDYNSDTLSIHARNKLRRSLTSADHSSDNNDVSADGNSVEQINEDFFLPHISMVESRYDLNIKREAAEHHAAASLRNNFPSAAFGLDYNFYKSNSSSAGSGQPPVSQEQYPNDIHMPSDYSKNFGNHMDIPPNGSNMVMLSSTSLLHGNCVFNRNNTVATQQGMKTYWLCKSYRISMCRARCITHQGRIISATGVHNHTPHMRGGSNNAVGSNNGAGGGSGSGSGGGGSGSGAGNANNLGGNTNGGNSIGGVLNENPQNPSSLINTNSSLYGSRYTQHSNTNMVQQNPQGHQPLAPVTSHLTTGVTSNHFSQNLPNLLIQPHVSNSSASLLQPTPLHTMPPTLQTPVIQNIMHPGMVHTTHANYEITPIMHASPADNGRHKTAIFEHQEKSLKNSLNDEHIPVHNEATPPPQTMKNSSAADVMRGVSEMEKDPGNGGVLGLHQHQAQIIESVTISPGGPSDGRANHNFKMETM